MDLGILKIVPFSTIRFIESNRARKEYNNIEQLAESIKKQGLLHPLTVYSASQEAPYDLLCGGRRYYALRRIGAAEVSIRLYNRPLGEHELKVIELMENIQRESLTDMERVKLTKEIDSTLKALHGAKLHGSPSLKGHSMRDTAKLLGRSQGSVQQDIALANAIEAHPELELEKAKNKTIAKKMVQRLEAFVKARLNEPFLEKGSLEESYIVGDFLTNTLPACCADFIECDPPYGIDLIENKYLVNPTNLKEYHEIPKSWYPQFTQRLAAELTRIAKEDCYLIFWHVSEWYNVIWNELSANGWRVSHAPGIWTKGYMAGQSRWPEYELSNSYEQFIIARKGNAQLRKKGRSNWFNFDPVHSAHKWHPAEKPPALMKEIIETFCWPGATIVAPFAGSGRTLIEGARLGHKVVGFDLSREYKDKFIESMEK